MKYYRGGDRKALQAQLRDKGFRSTEGRLELLAILKQSGRPLSVATIAQRMGTNLDEVSVYRALEALARVGLLVRVDLRRGGAHYEFAHAHHHHLTCTDCGRVADLDLCVDVSLEARALRQASAFASVRTHALEFFGTCSNCARS